MAQMLAAQAKMAQAMLLERKSKLGFDATVNAIEQAAKKRGWHWGGALDVQAGMKQAGHKDAKGFKVLATCKKELVEQLLQAQAAEKIMPFAPCRISVYEGLDGKTYVSRANTEMMAEMALPRFKPLLKTFVEEERAVLAGIVE
jgi:uncharacterized protein (DUF302 family)